MMHRLLAIPVGVLLLAALPVAAQNTDPFHETAPPAVPSPGQDPFQMAPTPAPKPVPAAPHPSPQPEPVVAIPPPPPPRDAFDGIYVGKKMLTRNDRQKKPCPDTGGVDYRIVVTNHKFPYDIRNEKIDVAVNPDGTFDGTRASGGWRFVGRIGNGDLTATSTYDSGCVYELHMRRQD